MPEDVAGGTRHEPNPFGWGILSGIIAGAVFGAFMMMVVAPVLGKPMTAPLNMIGAVFLGKALLMQSTTGGAFVGLMVHMMDSAIFGIIFVYLWRAWKSLGRSKGIEVLTGLAYGIIVWAVMIFVALPIIGSPMATVTGSWFLVGHMMFGMVLGWVAPRYA